MRRGKRRRVLECDCFGERKAEDEMRVLFGLEVVAFCLLSLDVSVPET